MERSKNLEKNISLPWKKKSPSYLLDRKSTVFEIPINLIRKACFQMTLNARKSCADSFLKIKIDDNRARFSRDQQSSEKFESETSKL